jgi:tetratricopeptide (TPR) repeat protein
MHANRLTQLHAFLRESPDDAFLLFALAQEYIKAGEFASALNTFAQLHQAHPDYVALYYHYGLLAHKTENSSLAVSLLEEGMQRAKTAKDMHAYGEMEALLEMVKG